MTEPVPAGKLSIFDLFGTYRGETPKKGKKALARARKEQEREERERQAEQVRQSDGDLMAFAMRSAPTLSPKPSPALLGVERLSKVTDAERLKANDLARTVIQSDGELTHHALDALRGWSGEGGLGGSTSAFYTPRALVDVVWAVSMALASPVRVLEPSCGGGAFLTAAPAGLELTAVEYDATTARIAQALHPHVAVHHAPFERYTTRSEDGPFDLVIGNPPFGARGASARLHRPDLTDAHWYFVLAGLERLKPGGYLAFVLPEAMMRNPSELALREAVVDAAHVLAVSAVPEGAFASTGAGVTTSVLFLRKHDAGVTEGLAALTDEERRSLRDRRLADDDYLKAFVNGQSLFRKDHAGNWELSWGDHHLGAHTHKKPVRSGRFGSPEYFGSLEADDHKITALTGLCQARRHDILTRTGLESAAFTLLSVESADRVRRTPMRLHAIQDGTLSPDRAYRFRMGKWSYNGPLENPATLSALSVAQAVVRARTQAVRGGPGALTAKHRALTEHEEHLARYGAYDLASLEQGARQIPLLRLLVDARGNVEKLLADLTPPKTVIQPGTVQHVAQQLESYGLLTLENLTAYAGVPRAAAAAHLLSAYAFTGRVWEDASTYYRGNAAEKARQAELLADNARGLERDALLDQASKLRALAPWRDLSDMVLEPRDPLMPEAALTEWVNAYLGTKVAVKRNQWDAEGEPANLIIASRGEFGVSLRVRNTLDEKMNLADRQQIPAARVRDLEAYLNFRTPVEPVHSQDTKTPELINAERNVNQERAMRSEKMIAAHFREWAFGSEYAPHIESALNEGRYGLIEGQTDMRPLNLSAWRGPEPHPFQAGHVRNLARMSGAIVEFSVGLGKTYTGLMLAALLLQSGRARMPTIVVPLSRLGDWVMNALSALPDLKLLVIGGDVQKNADGTYRVDEHGEPDVREDAGPRRKKKMMQLISDAPELVIMTAEAFESIPMLEDTRLSYIEREATLMSGVGTASSFDDRSRKMSGHKALAKRERFLQRHMARVKVSTETDVPFEATGIDAVIVDECHMHKSVFAAPTVYGESNPKFLGGSGESNRALDALHKFRFVRAQGGCTVGLTATWFTNSPLEIFNMLTLYTDELARYGISDVGAFTARFCVIEPRLITLPNGDVEYRSCVIGFRNLDEMRAIIFQHVVRETEDTCLMQGGEVGMKLPDLVTQEHFFDLAPAVQARYDEEQGKVEEADSKGQNHLFAIFGRLMKLTLHPQLLGVDAPNPRFAECVKACLSARERGGRNVVFMYMGGEGGQAYEALKDAMIAAGYPEREIVVLTATTHPKSGERLKVERRLRRGEISCVIGSAVIEQGANYQGCTDLHHLDYPHHHQAFKQRIGRARRQGTWVREVHNHLYFARGSFDVLRYQGMLGKKGWAEQVYDPSVITCENMDLGFDGEEIAVMLSRDPDLTRRTIQAKREARAQESRAATLLADLDVIRTYMEYVKLLALRHRTAAAREKGPSSQDVAGINRLVTSLRALHGRVRALQQAGHPMAALTRLERPITWAQGLPLHQGMTLELGGRDLTVKRAAAADPEVIVLVGSAHENVMVDQFSAAKNVLPTRDENAYGQDIFESLPSTLRERIESSDVGPVTANLTLPVPAAPLLAGAALQGEQAAAPADQAAPIASSAGESANIPFTPASKTPKPLRYGLSVAAAVVSGATVFTVAGDTLVPGSQDGAPLLALEYRPNGDLRQVNLIFPDDARRDATRRLIKASDPRLRQRVDALLASVV